MNKIITLALVALVAGGIYIVFSAMAPEAAAHVNSNCYNAMNAAGQIVSVICH